jgi:hypothetical protein
MSGSITASTAGGLNGTFTLIGDGATNASKMLRARERPSRGAMVRIMEEGGGRTNYYRVSVPGKQAFTVSGEVSTDPALTHIPIGSTSLQDILRTIAGIGQ